MVTSNQEPDRTLPYVEGLSYVYFSIARRLAEFVATAVDEERVDETTRRRYRKLLYELESGGFKNEMVEAGILSGLQHSEEFTRGICVARDNFIKIAGR